VPEPKTLLDMAGVPARPHPLAEASVVMIDAQMEYVTGRVPLVGIGSALDQGARLLEAARGLGRPVVHVAHKGRAGGLFDPESEFFGFAPQAAPLAGEPVIEKALPNAFAGTTLDETLKGLDAKTLVVAGFMTHMCVSSTVRAALDLGYSCTVLGSACATRDLPDGRGDVVPADALHRAELAALADRFAMLAWDVAELEG
jgi:nicotinamidase-related amidase